MERPCLLTSMIRWKKTIAVWILNTTNIYFQGNIDNVSIDRFLTFVRSTYKDFVGLYTDKNQKVYINGSESDVENRYSELIKIQ